MRNIETRYRNSKAMEEKKRLKKLGNFKKGQNKKKA